MTAVAVRGAGRTAAFVEVSFSNSSVVPSHSRTSPACAVERLVTVHAKSGLVRPKAGRAPALPTSGTRPAPLELLASTTRMERRARWA